jgi:hypothetical protein
VHIELAEIVEDEGFLALASTTDTLIGRAYPF